MEVMFTGCQADIVQLWEDSVLLQEALQASDAFLRSCGVAADQVPCIWSDCLESGLSQKNVPADVEDPMLMVPWGFVHGKPSSSIWEKVQSDPNAINLHSASLIARAEGGHCWQVGMKARDQPLSW